MTILLSRPTSICGQTTRPRLDSPTAPVLTQQGQMHVLVHPAENTRGTHVHVGCLQLTSLHFGSFSLDADCGFLVNMEGPYNSCNTRNMHEMFLRIKANFDL